MLNETSQVQKDKYCMYDSTYKSRIGKLIESEVDRLLEAGRRKNGYRDFALGDTKILEIVVIIVHLMNCTFKNDYSGRITFYVYILPNY